VDVEHVDFLSVHSTDIERSRRFYLDTLGLPLDVDRGERGFEVRAGQLCLSIWNPTAAGMDLGSSPAHLALHVDDVAKARRRLEEKGIEFEGDVFDTGVCHMAFFRDPDGNALMLHRRYAPLP
jgi:catechol 2,3-dioxygenase-like lactoylglutathione lyase family enzyme